MKRIKIVDFGKRQLHRVSDIFVMIIGSAVMAAGISLFLDPNELAPGGVTGIAIMLSRVLPAQTGTWIILLNIPLLILGLKKLGGEFFFYTVFSTLLSSAFMNIIESTMKDLPPITTDPLLAGVTGGVLIAIGTGIIFRVGGSTGGRDIIVVVLRQKFRHIGSGAMMLAIDAAVIAVSAVFFKNLEVALWAGISLVVNSYVFDKILYGTDSAKMLFIVSDNSDVIATRIITELGIGATYLSGQGAYTHADKNILFCVAHKRLFPKICDIVKAEDSRAFLIVSSANEVFGEGFKNPEQLEM